jgi:myosin heavy chain 6/7
MSKMDTRIRELESELDAENRRQADAVKNLRRSERRINELTFAADEDRKNHERMQGLIDGLQGKIKTYKKQIEEAEEIAALNLAKFRKVAASVDEAAGRADISEQAVAKARARGRSTSAAPQ